MELDAQVEMLRAELAASAELILTAASTGLDHLRVARSGDLRPLSDLEEELCRIVSACSFHDLAEQRLSQLSARIHNRTAFGDDPLLNGPAAPGEGVDQSAIDRLFNGEGDAC